MSYNVSTVPMGDILSDENFNCRGAKILPIDVIDLAQEIEKDGLLYPITIQPYDKNGKKFRIVAGHRRYAAFKVLGRTEIPCFMRDDLDECSARRLNLTENLKRQDLTIFQEAKAIEYFFKVGWNEADVAEQIGASRGWVQVRRMLLALPEDIQQEAAVGILGQDNIRRIYTLREDPEAMYELVRAIKDHQSRGQALKFVKPEKPHRKEARSPADIHYLQDRIIQYLGFCLTTQVMGWAAGVVSDYEIHIAIREACIEKGIHSYEIPKKILQQL